MARPTKREETNRKISEAKSKVTDEVLSLLRQAFAVDATIEEACFYAGISDSTYYRYREKNPEVCSEIERLRLTPILKARQTIVNGLEHVNTAQWFIERKRADEFATKTKTEHSGKIETEDVTQPEAVKAVVEKFHDDLKAVIIAGRKKQPTKV